MSSEEADAKTNPQIEPPCPECAAVRSATNGSQPWCARHREHHPKAHVYSELPEPYGVGAALIRPDEGSDMGNGPR